MGAIAPQITSLAIVYSAFYSGADQRKHQSSASLAFVRGIHRGPVNSPHKWPVTRKMFPFDDVIMYKQQIMPHIQLYSLMSRAIFHFRLHRADSRFAPSQCETALLRNDVSHWPHNSGESALYIIRRATQWQHSYASRYWGACCQCQWHVPQRRSQDYVNGKRKHNNTRLN